jgi:hypothetical protein
MLAPPVCGAGTSPQVGRETPRSLEWENTMSTHRASSAILFAALVALSSAGRGVLAAAPATVESRQVGATSVVYRGPVISVALSYKFTRLHPQGNWLFLDTVMTASGAPFDLLRTAIAVRTPSGDVVPLASQQQFVTAYPELGASIQEANAMLEPLAYLPPHPARSLGLFSEDGRNLAWPSVGLDQWHLDLGRLYFQIPGGIQRGKYELLFALSDGEVAIPFTI